MSLTAMLLFIGILLVLVIVHEFGHFIAAKLVGMRVDEFAFGFPPRLFGIKKGETLYAINAIPLGGYVSIFGENGTEDDKKAHGAHNNPRAFGNRPSWAQFIVLIAGVTMNMLLALCLFIGISYGTVQVSVDDPVFGARVTKSYIMVTEVSKESPAFKAGIVPGSIILSMKSNGEDAKLTTATSLITFIGKNQNNAFAITYRTPNGEDKKTTVAAVYGILENKKALGIAVEQVGEVKTTFLEAVELGYTKTVTMTSMTFTGLKDVLTSAFSGKNVIDSLSGPVGIAKIVGETSEYGYVAVLTLVAVLSINLAIFNALPLPALDGGRIVVVLIESIIRKKVPFKYYSWVNVVGFSLLLLLLIIVTIHDLKG